MMEMMNKPNASAFFENVARIIEQARAFVGRTADLTMCVTYFEVGRMIVEEEQGGKARAEYGKGLLMGLSTFLNNRVGKGFSESTLRNARKFYQVYAPSIQQTLFAESQKGQSLSAFFDKTQKQQTLFAESYPFSLGWSHYLILMRIENEQERRFYEIEAARQQWTYRQLQRQYGSSLDLVFYNRLLQCYVLIDLKTGKLKHQDLGQMQMYVNYFDRFVKTDKETPTVGILLCKEKNDNIVELTLPEDSNIYASAYSLYLPDKALLQRKLAEWVEEFEEEHGGDGK